MQVLKFYAELQTNPRSKVAYRNLADYYKSRNMQNEADAFLELIRRKFDDHSPSTDQEQRPHNSEMP
jgi:5-hydroxyisourate hydrolase-like protein (transthyretin family)